MKLFLTSCAFLAVASASAPLRGTQSKYIWANLKSHLNSSSLGSLRSPSTPSTPDLYCPTEKDFVAGGPVTLHGGGWTITGSGGVHGLTAFNLLGGYIEFDMDVTNAHNSVNNNLYTSSPDRSLFPNYCDIQPNESPQCMEMDIIENNGGCMAQSTWHTWPNHDGDCDESGCWGQIFIKGKGKFHVKADFSSDGWMSVSIDGQQFSYTNPVPSANAKAYVAQIMQSTGAQIQSSQWQGWVPGDCGQGDLGSSSFTVSNIRVKGSVVQGRQPDKCNVTTSLYCPTAADMNLEHGNVHFLNNGWSFIGDSRVSSKTAWNLLGGYLEFDMDTTKVAAGVNTNLYTSSPEQPNCGEACYCDIQRSNAGKPSCMEMDIIENNGNCAMATTIHTFANDGTPNNPNCDRWGCGSQAKLPGGKFHIKAAFGDDGSMSVTLNGVPNTNYSPFPSSASNQVVVDTMKRIGAVIESSQWFGWVPAGNVCPTGDASGLSNSYVEITNVRVMGTVVQGPAPTKCQQF